MNNFVAVMKAEVARLTRKEIRAEVEGLRKAYAQQRTEILELKRQVAALHKALAQLGPGSGRSKPTAAVVTDEPVKRFSSKGFASQRKKLGISAEEAATILQVSVPTVYGWEKGRKPQSHQMGAIAAFRKLGKREAKQLLERAGE